MQKQDGGPSHWLFLKNRGREKVPGCALDTEDALMQTSNRKKIKIHFKKVYGAEKSRS